MEKAKRSNRQSRPTTNNFSTIVNLSSYQPNIYELKLLSRGLKFVPSNKPDPLEIQKDNLIFQRRLKLAQHFKDDVNDNIQDKFKRSSGWTPSNAMPKHLNCFFINTEHQIRKINFQKTRPNLTRKEKDAIKT